MKIPTKPKLIPGLVAAVVVPIGAVATAVMLSMSPNVAEASPMFMPVAETTEPTQAQAVEFGPAVRDGNFSFEVTHMSRTTATVDLENIYFDLFAKGEFVIVDYVLTNVSGESQTFFPLSSTLTDGTKIYPADEHNWGGANPSFDLGPGESFPTSIMFDVPRGTDVQSIAFHGSPSSEGVTLDL